MRLQGGFTKIYSEQDELIRSRARFYMKCDLTRPQKQMIAQIIRSSKKEFSQTLSTDVFIRVLETFTLKSSCYM